MRLLINRALLASAVLVGTLWNAAAWAHGGQPALATFPLMPPCVRVSDRAEIRWSEPEFPSVFGASVVELGVTTTSTRPLYTRERPLVPWTPIHHVLDSDPANLFVWNTATVAAGHYFLWSYIEEPMQENADFLAFQAPFVVTIEHGEPLGPTVMMLRPESFTSASDRYQLAYAACDPTGTARVRLEAAPENRPLDYHVIADDLPAVVDGTYTWDTRALAQVRWIVRARIYDTCGHVFESHARAFIEVRPPLDPVDAGPADVRQAGPIDAMFGGGAACAPTVDGGAAMDASVPAKAPDASACTAAPCTSEEGCGCATTTARGPAVSALVLMIVWGAYRRRRQRE